MVSPFSFSSLLFVSHCDHLIIVTLASSSHVLAMMEAPQTSDSMSSNVHLLTHVRLGRWHPMLMGPPIPLKSFV